MMVMIMTMTTATMTAATATTTASIPKTLNFGDWLWPTYKDQAQQSKFPLPPNPLPENRDKPTPITIIFLMLCFKETMDKD
jgi:hypothetical protein